MTYIDHIESAAERRALAPYICIALEDVGIDMKTVKLYRYWHDYENWYNGVLSTGYLMKITGARFRKGMR